MSDIKFVSHQSFPDDLYTKELVYLELNVPARVAFVRKQAKNGGYFWSGVSLGVTKDMQKAYFPAFMQDSAFLESDIKDYLDKRKWETKSQSVQQSLQDDVPF